MKPYTAAVVGLGRIGQGYDYDCAGDAHVLTHAACFRHHPGFELVAGVDPDAQARARFESKYARPAFVSLQEIPDGLCPEVWSIGVPTAEHAQAFAAALARGPRAILCEKPLAASLDNAHAMVATARAAGCALLVNYMRRCEPGVRALRAALAGGRCGTIYKGVCWYGKGLRHNGSHFIDLFRFLLGEATDCAVLAAGRRWEGADPEPDARIRFGDADITFLAAREECYSIAEFELIGTAGRVAYRNGGTTIELRGLEADPDFPGYSILAATPAVVPNDFLRYQWHVADHLYRHLAEGQPLDAGGESALRTLQAVESLISHLQG